MRIDACCLTEPIPKGALRGGSHVHTFDGDGQWIAFTYEDHLLTAAMGHTGAERNQRNVGISVPGKSVIVPKDHPRNADGEYFSVLVSQTIDDPQPGSDEINRAYEDAWVGSLGYQRMDGSQQKRAIAFLGDTIADNGSRVTELFLLDLPDDLTQPGPDGPLGGTLRTRPRPPRGVTQTRLTHTADREFPGLQGPRHWPRSSPDGVHIACLMRDTYGVVQLWLVSPNGGAPQQLTWLSTPIASAFSFSPDGRWIAFVSDHSVCVTQVTDGHTVRLTARDDSIASPRPEACVFSPDGTRIAYVCSVPQGDNVYNQIFNVRVELPR